MDLEFQKAFVFVRNGNEPTYITLHTGPQFGFPKYRDMDSDVVASLCWMKTGGNLLIAMLPRNIIGIDLNRDVPTKEQAIKYWKHAINNSKDYIDYMKRYGWVAKDEKDYNDKMQMYNDFWNKVRELSSPFIFIHTQDVRIGNFPSLMDFISFDGKGIEKKKLRKAVSKLNKKFAQKFLEIKDLFGESILLNHKLEVENVMMYSDVYKERKERDLRTLERYADKDIFSEVQKNFTKNTFLNCVENIIKKDIMPVLTVEQNFTGSRAYAPKREIIDRERIVVEIEINKFLATQMPRLATEIIIDFIGMV